jgi:hypothetical protein
MGIRVISVDSNVATPGPEVYEVRNGMMIARAFLFEEKVPLGKNSLPCPDLMCRCVKCQVGPRRRKFAVS